MFRPQFFTKSDRLLGKNESRSYLEQQYGIEISNDRIPTKWDDLWKQGEELYRRKQRKD